MASEIRQDFLLQPVKDANGKTIYFDFPLGDTIIDGKYLPTPYGDSDKQHITDIIVYEKGWLKQFPTIGFGVNKYINSEVNIQSIEKSLKQEVSKDGYIAQHGAVEPASGKGNGFIIYSKYIVRK